MVEILRYPTEEDWLRCKLLAISTSGKKHAKTADTEWRKKILRCEHSPIRTLMFTVRMDVPYYVSVHFCRHKYGVEHYVSSQRNDRQNKYNRLEAPQAAMVTHVMDVNAQALMQIARKRLCGKADPATRKIMQDIVEAVVKVAPEFEELLVPQCKYFHECKEFQTCGMMER